MSPFAYRFLGLWSSLAGFLAVRDYPVAAGGFSSAARALASPALAVAERST
ncbi:hypothetical protein MAB47J26_14382 [Mycobacteroides abscessus 47J26]|nr:hypothetical protein MAB47J26_14382 [Mycobacteroides abscessus 47J26]